MDDTSVLLLDEFQIQHKLERIALQIIESNFNEKEIIISGIMNKGFFLAKQLAGYLEKHCDWKIVLTSIKIDKRNPLQKPVEYNIPDSDLDSKVIVVVDDVANTGRTLFYSLKLFQDRQPKKIQVAVLIDRQHKTFPINPDFVGLSLSTTLQEHIELHTSGKPTAYLK